MSGAAEPAQGHERTPSGRSEAASTPSRAKSGPRRWRSAAKWTAGALLTLDLGVLLVTLSLASATADGP
ncbi:MAG: hypothetical protein U1B78_03030, partial [Dehalococcoidia bacterium]|nr:hypothetical protein [Dehalococcoidia bacterium]